jgi:hypothetical protein
MTSVLTREEFRARTREEFRARLMALLLTAVLVWYTLVVVPPYAPAPRRAGPLRDDEGADGEMRQARGARAGEKAGTEASDILVEELDWPEYIGLD